MLSRNGAKPPVKADTAQIVQFPKVSSASAKTSPRAGSSAKKIRRPTPNHVPEFIFTPSTFLYFGFT